MHDDLKSHIEQLHSCKVVEYLGQTIVNETFGGSPVWQGIVHQFRIDGNKESEYCYAWLSEDPEKRRTYAVLHIPPVDSPEKAVRASIIRDFKEK